MMALSLCQGPTLSLAHGHPSDGQGRSALCPGIPPEPEVTGQTLIVPDSRLVDWQYDTVSGWLILSWRIDEHITLITSRVVVNIDTTNNQASVAAFPTFYRIEKDGVLIGSFIDREANGNCADIVRYP